MSAPKFEAGDFWGGLAAMLVALPSAIAFGVTIYSPLGASHAAQGALAGMLGATALAAIIGGSVLKLDPIDAPTARRMIDRHNLYHLPADERESWLRLNVGPALFPGGGGIALSGSF